jgi:hypothetical protein
MHKPGADKGRRLPEEEEFFDCGFQLHDQQTRRRREVLRETLNRFTEANPPDKYHHLAQQNLQNWRSQQATRHAKPHTVQILPGDWGEVTQAVTGQYGACFAVLNMANAFVPGGGYVEGAMAQEENMFRRTDCHFSIDDHNYNKHRDRYHPQWTALLSGENGRVFLDTENPRTCLRGPEDLTQPDLGYPWLSDDQLFPFFELRAAAIDLRSGSAFSPQGMTARIAVQLDTLIQNDIKHAVLGAFGCGAFGNPARQVAEIYREQISRRSASFSVIAFAIFHAGYGRDNYTPFRDVFAQEVVLG